jgi:DNA-binding beta-propeller fold protein YncE
MGGIMPRRTIGHLFFVFLLGAEIAAAQVKIAQLSGAPGAFNATSSIVFKASGNMGYISNTVSGVVLKFRSTTGEVLESLQLSPGIASLALSPDERTLVVLNVTKQILQIIDTETMVVRKEASYENSGFTALNNIVFSEDGFRFLIPDATRNRVMVFNSRDGSFDRYIMVGVNPGIMTPAAGTRLLVVVCSGRKPDDERGLYIIDTYSLAIVNSTSLSEFRVESFNSAQILSSSSMVYCPSYNDNRLIVYDMKSYSLGSRLIKGDGPGKIVISPNGSFMALANAKSKTVELYRLPEAVLIQNIIIPGLDLSVDSTLAFSPDSRTLFIPAAATGEILSYNIDALTIRSHIPTGDGPTRLKMNPEGTVLSSIEFQANLLSLIALKPSPLYIPHLTQNAKEYAGIAFANFAEESANVALIARGNDGRSLPGTSNPRYLTVPSGQQIALVAGQVFGFDPSATVDGYIEVYTMGKGMNALYMTGDIAQTYLGGLTADAVSATLLGFGRITEGIVKFGSPTSTDIIMLNPGEDEASLTLRMFKRTIEGPGMMIGYATLKLPAHNRLQTRISNLIGAGHYPMENAYLEVTSDVPLKGLSVVKIGTNFAMIPAQPRGLEEISFFAAQFASGGAGVLGTPIYSNLSFTNSAQYPITITTQVIDENGKLVPPDSKPSVHTLQAYESISGGADELLGWPDPLKDPVLYQGTLQIDVDKKGLLVDLLYGDARNGKYLTPVNLHARYGKEFGIGHLAEGLFGDPAKGLYTGLAIYNPNRGFANITAEAFSPQGKSIGRTEFMVEKASRISKTIGQIVPVIQQQNGGTIRITSDIPLLLFAVFGSALDEFLVAVPPIILTP